MRTKKTQPKMYGYLTTSSDMKSDANIFLQDSIDTDVIVRTTNKFVVENLQMLKDQLQRDVKDNFMRFFRNVSDALIKADVDGIYRSMRLNREWAKQAWQDVCDDAVIHSLCKHVLWKRPIIIRKPSDDCFSRP